MRIPTRYNFLTHIFNNKNGTKQYCCNGYGGGFMIYESTLETLEDMQQWSEWEDIKSVRKYQQAIEFIKQKQMEATK